MLLRLARASLRRSFRRTATAAAALFVPAALAAAVSNFALDAKAKMSRELRRRGPNLVIAGAVDRVPFEALRSSLPGVVAGTPLARGLWRVEGRDLPLYGFDLAEARRLREGWRVEGSWPGEGLLVGARLAERLRLVPGDQLGGLPVEGVADTGGPEDEAVFAPLEAALARGARVETIEWSLAASVEEVEAAASAIEARHPGVEARVQRSIAAGEEAILERLTLAFLLVGVFVLVVSALSVATTLGAAVAERRGEFAVLRALGAGDGRILRLLGTEVAALLALGGGTGLLAGVALSSTLARAAFGEAAAFRPGAAAATALACLVVALLGAAGPARRALAVAPARALRGE